MSTNDTVLEILRMEISDDMKRLALETLKESYKPERRESRLVGADYAQAEARMAAAMSSSSRGSAASFLGGAL